jgi:hypothetical protein
MQGSKKNEQKKTTHRSEGRSLLKKDLTGPTLLEMSGNATNQELTAFRLDWTIVASEIEKNALAHRNHHRPEFGSSGRNFCCRAVSCNPVAGKALSSDKSSSASEAMGVDCLAFTICHILHLVSGVGHMA